MRSCGRKKEEKARKAEAARLAHEEEKARRMRLARRKKPATAAGSAKQVAELHRHVHHHLHHVHEVDSGDERVLGAEADLQVENNQAPAPPTALPPSSALGARTKSALLRTDGAERVPVYAKKVDATQALYAKSHKANLQELQKYGKAEPRKLAWN